MLRVSDGVKIAIKDCERMEVKKMKIVFMVIFVLAYVLSVLRSFVDNPHPTNAQAVMVSIVLVTSFAGMLWVLAFGG